MSRCPSSWVAKVARGRRLLPSSCLDQRPSRASLHSIRVHPAVSLPEPFRHSAASLTACHPMPWRPKSESARSRGGPRHRPPQGRRGHPANLQRTYGTRAAPRVGDVGRETQVPLWLRATSAAWTANSKALAACTSRLKRVSASLRQFNGTRDMNSMSLTMSINC